MEGESGGEQAGTGRVVSCAFSIQILRFISPLTEFATLTTTAKNSTNSPAL
jgi:hypothetical protein